MNSVQRSGILFPLAVSLIAGCTHKHADDDEDSQSAAPAVVAVKVAPLMKGDSDVVVTATGKTDALNRAKVFSPIAGRIQSLNVVEGMPVKTGDVLAVIQSRESHAAIAGAEALLQSAQTPEEKSEAGRTLSLAKSTESSVSVRARSDGVVGTRSVNAGEFIAENAELLTLVDLSSIDFIADVLLRDLPSVHIGQSCTIHFQSLPARGFTARVDAIYPQTDEQSQTIKVRLRFQDHSSLQNAHLRTDMAGIARIVVGRHQNAFMVPKAAVLRNDETGTQTIVTMTADSLAKAIEVSVGSTTDSLTEVSGEGLHEGMNVIVEGNYALSDSTRVTVAKQENR